MADGVQLPPGYRFYPTEEELICFYLRNKLDSRRDDIERVIPVVEVYSVDPWQLSEIHARLCGGGSEGEPWFYFCARQEREARGGRPSRTTPSGYWKAAGTPGVVYSASGRRPIGMRKTMVFYRGRAPSGSKTKWKMNEYRALQHHDDEANAGAGAAATEPAVAPPSNHLPPQVTLDGTHPTDTASCIDRPKLSYLSTASISVYKLDRYGCPLFAPDKCPKAACNSLLSYSLSDYMCGAYR